MAYSGIGFKGKTFAGVQFNVYGATCLVVGVTDLDETAQYLASKLPVPGNGKSYDGLLVLFNPVLGNEDTRIGPGLDTGQSTNVTIEEGTAIGSNVKIGNDVLIEKGVVVGGRTKIENNVKIESDNNIPSDSVVVEGTTIPAGLFDGSDRQARLGVQRFAAIDQALVDRIVRDRQFEIAELTAPIAGR